MSNDKSMEDIIGSIKKIISNEKFIVVREEDLLKGNGQRGFNELRLKYSGKAFDYYEIKKKITKYLVNNETDVDNDTDKILSLLGISEEGK